MDAKREEEYRALLRSRLSEKRYEHSLAVARQAERLARQYGCDPDKAYEAGLLHDIMKDANDREMLQTFREFDIILSDVEKNARKLWHAVAGRAYLANVLHVQDEDLLNAVRYHTTARAGMSALEKVVYLADYTSDDRDYEGVEEMRRAVQGELRRAMLIALEYSIREVVEKKGALHPDTVEAYNETVLHP